MEFALEFERNNDVIGAARSRGVELIFDTGNGIDKQGLWIIKPQFKIAFNFIDSLALAQTGTQCVAIDKYGNTIDTWALLDENQNCPRGDYQGRDIN